MTMRKTTNILCTLLVIAFCVIWARPFHAAGMKLAGTNDSWLIENRTVNGTVFTCPQSSYSKGTYTLRATRNGITKTICTNCNGGTILSDGTNIYYCGKSGGAYILYNANIDTLQVTQVATLSTTAHGIDLCGIYKNKIYFIIDVPEGTFARVDVKTGKQRRLRKNVTTADWNGRYYLLSDGTGAGHSYLGVWNAASGKYRTITKKPYIWEMTNKYVYYLEVKSGNTWDGKGLTAAMKRYTLKSGKNRVLVKTLKIKRILEVTDSYFRYTNMNGKTRTKKWK